MEVSERIREMLSERAGDLELRNHALSHGMESLLANGLMKVKAGITTIDEVLQVAEQA
jgi:type IV pilus assembly protein PilB